jgi:putative aldouronate transport system substrate-binding protein
MTFSTDLSRRRLNRRTLLGTGASATAGLAGASLLRQSAFAQDATPEAPSAGDKVLTPADLPEPMHSYPLVTEKKTFTAMVPSYGTEWIDNDMTRWYEELTGVHIEWQVVQAEGAVQQLNLALASGDYPDIVFGFNWSPFELTMSTIGAYGEQGLFVPLNDYLEDNAPHLLTHVSEEYPVAKKIVTLPDGTIYSMPYVNDCYHCQFWDQRMWIHTGWLDTLGLSMPETTDDLVEVLTAFRDGDPNGNGEQDEFPLTSQVANSLSTFLVNPFTRSPGRTGNWLYFDDNGEITATYLNEGFFEGAEYLAGLTAEGLLDAEAFTRDADQLRALGDAQGGSRIGMVPAGWGGYITLVEGEAGEWASYKVVPPLTGPSGVRQVDRDFDEPHHGNVFVVTDKCDDPALAVAWADGLYQFEATMRAVEGVPDRNWRFAEDGEVGVDGRPALWTRIPTDPIPEGSDDPRSWRQLGPSYRSNAIRLGQSVLVDPELSTEVILYNESKDKLEPYANGPETDLLRPVFTPEASNRVIELETAITQLVEATFAQIATGQGGPSWEDFQGQLQSLGVDEYLQLYSESQG